MLTKAHGEHAADLVLNGVSDQGYLDENNGTCGPVSKGVAWYLLVSLNAPGIE